MEPFRFCLITDVHYYNRENGDFTGLDQVCLNEADVITDAAFRQIAAMDDLDTVLIAGDVTDNGRKNEHSAFIEKLKILTDAGKRVFVITATHDYGLKVLDENYTRENVEPYRVMRDDLFEMYAPFGRDQALAAHSSGSYCVKLEEGLRLLALNDDGNGRSFCGYDDDELGWILAQIEDAKAARDYIFAMTHHPMLPPSPVFPMISERDMLGNYKEVARILADAGLEFMFTGHTHMQNISSFTTEKGNTIYDVNSGSLIGYPGPMRICEIDDEKMKIETIQIDDIDGLPDGNDLRTHMRLQFDAMLTKLFYSMAFDFDEFKGMAGAFSVDGESLNKFKLPITMVGKILQKLTVGKLGRLLFCSGKIRKEVKNTLLKDVIVECTRNIWTGNEPYGPDTPLGASLLAIAGRLQPIAGRFADKMPALADLPGFLLSLIYDGGIDDHNAELPRRK